DLRERRQRAVGVEVVGAEAEVVDARRRVGAGAADRQELRSGADPQQRRLPLPRLNRHAEESLIEIDRALRIRHAQRHVVERAYRYEGAGGRLRKDSRGRTERWQRFQKGATV